MVVYCRVLLFASLLATIASTLGAYPHELAYFNELSGGPKNGHRHLLHSNLDWGQDFVLLKHTIAHEAPVTVYCISPPGSNLFAPHYIGVPCKVIPSTHLLSKDGRLESKSPHILNDSNDWLVVGETAYQTIRRASPLGLANGLEHHPQCGWSIRIANATAFDTLVNVANGTGD